MQFIQGLYRGNSGTIPGRCIPCNRPQPCITDNPRYETLRCALTVNLGNPTLSSISWEFLGNRVGRVGNSITCSAQTAPYLALANAGASNFTATVDPWAALADGAWTSSALIILRAAMTYPYGPIQDDYTLRVETLPVGQEPLLQTATGDLPYQATGCPATVLKQIAVYDNGTFLILP